MSQFSIADRLRLGFAATVRFAAQSRTVLLVALVSALAVSWIASSFVWGQDVLRNRAIAALNQGHDVPTSQNAASKLVFARAYFLMTHSELDVAQALVGRFDLEGDKQERAVLHYDLGNARLMAAFEKIDASDFDAAAAFVGLAQENYIEAMRLDPDLWRARYNFDVAARLVRQYPNFMNTFDPRREGPRPIWTELPNVPEGEP